MDNGRVISWGIMGTAAIAVDHVIPAIEAARGCAVAALASRTKERAAELAGTLGIPCHYGSYDGLLADPDVDCVYVPLPNSMHLDWTLRAIQAGKAVLVEKPMADKREDVQRMAETAAAAGVLLAEAFMYRYHPQLQWLLELVRGGELGTVRVIRGSIGFVIGEPPDIRLDPELGGGALLDVGCYPLDAMCLIYGTAPTAARAVSCYRGGVDQLSAAVLEFPGERVGLMDATFRLPWLRSPLEVSGERGTVRLDNAFNPGQRPATGVLLRPGAPDQPLTFEGMNAYRAMVESFSDSFRSGTPPRYDLHASLATATASDLVRYAGARGEHSLFMKTPMLFSLARRPAP